MALIVDAISPKILMRSKLYSNGSNNIDAAVVNGSRLYTIVIHFEIDYQRS